MFGITYLGSGDVPFYSPVFLGCSACAVVIGFLFVRHSRTGPAPFVPYRLLRGRGFGMGLSVPATNNASLQLAPDQVAAIAGLRGMFRQSGAITAVSVTTAVIAGSAGAEAGIMQAHAFLVFAGIVVLLLPLVRFVPEHHGTW